MGELDRQNRRVSRWLYAALFLGAAAQTEITPLLPRIGERFGASEAAIGLLVAAPAIMVLALCIPIGLLADRLGARRLTIAACGLLCVAAFGQAIPSYAAVVVARLVFGVAWGALLTAGVSWLSQSAGAAGSARLGATVTSTSVGTIVGPAIGGLLGQDVGLGAPFVAAGAAAALVTLALFACPVPVRRPAPAHATASLHDLAGAARDPGVRGAAGALAISGAVGGAVQLLVPIQLHAAHLSAGSIGLAFSAAAVVYIATSALVVAAGARAVSLRLNAICAVAIALALAPAAVSLSVVAVVATLLATSLPRSAVGTLCYPLATSAGARSGHGSGIAIGVVNAAWAAGLVATPLLAGVLSPAIGTRGVYLTLLATTSLGGVILWLHAGPAGAGPRLRGPSEHAPAARRWERQLRVARRSDA